MKRLCLLPALALVTLVASCAPKVLPPPPEGEDYVAPVAGADVSARARNDLDKAWRKVMTGDTEGAEGEYQKILGREPGLMAARTGLAYAMLRAGDDAGASAAFATILEEHPEDLPALVGAASAAFGQGDVDGAFQHSRRALAVAPENPLVRKRAAALKLQVTERHMAAADEAQAAGDEIRALEEYRLALDAAPELPTLRLSLADLLVDRGETGQAVATLRDDPSEDHQVAVRLGQILLGRGEFEEALDVYRSLLARNPSDVEARRGVRTAQEALDFQAQPDEYRRIVSAPRATRADLAALLAVKVTALSRLDMREPRVAVDIAGSWAREHVATIVGLGIMEVYPNHTFQPRATVRRADLARAVNRVLVRLGWRGTAGQAPADMSPSHLDHRAVTRVVGAGLMPLGADGRFEPWRPVTGQEVVAVVEGLAEVVGP